MALRKVDFIVVQDDWKYKLPDNIYYTCHLKGNRSNGKGADACHAQSSSSVDFHVKCSLQPANLRHIYD